MTPLETPEPMRLEIGSAIVSALPFSWSAAPFATMVAPVEAPRPVLDWTATTPALTVLDPV